MSFGYPQYFTNLINNPSQLRRATDMVYQRGGTYQVIMTGNTYIQTMRLDIDLYKDVDVVGRMSVIPSKITQSGSTYTYEFNFRPYDYMSNYCKAQHHENYYMNDWYSTTELINWNNPYPNIIETSFRYGYRYITGNTTVTEYPTIPTRPYNHYTDIPSSLNDVSFVPSGFTNTGGSFSYVGGIFQMEEKYILPNFDQEVGSVVGTGFTLNTIDVNRRLSPMSQFLMDYPNLPEQSDASRFLTEAPRIQYIQSNESYVLYYLNGQTGDRQVIEADFAVFEFYNENNTRTGYFEQELNFSGTTYATPTGFTNTLSIFSLPVGPSDINNIFSTIDFDDVAYYTVQLFYGYPTNNPLRSPTGAIGPVSEMFYFYLYNNCLPENTRVVWLNSRGGYDYYTFQSYRQNTSKISRSTFDSRYYATDIQSPDRDWGRTLKTFATDVDQEVVLETNYLNLPYAHWIEELFTSPQVYIMKEDYVSPLDRQDKVYKDLRPVQVISTEVEHLTKKHRKLNKYRITLKSAQTTFVNRGF